MFPTADGSFRLFRAFGINVYLHWTWFVAAWIFYSRPSIFGTGWYFALTYGSLFGIVLMHEFGHALACRSVGGRAQRIVLWPLGGVAYVEPPERPGAVLWSIVAGPLVNVLLVPITVVAYFWAAAGGGNLPPEIVYYFKLLMSINLTLLVFNLLPVYPLDGGQILMAMLWFVIGRARALRVTSMVGLVAAAIIAPLALLAGEMLLLVMAAFIGWQAYIGFRIARELAHEERQERELNHRISVEYGRWP